MKTLFEKIVAREIPASIVYEDDLVLAFRDIKPQAPTHVLIVPKKPIPRIAEAKPEEGKNETTYVIPGPSSKARTPLSSPILLILTDQLQADKLQLYKLESKGGQRQILFTRRKKQVARPFRLNVTRVDDNLYRIEVDEILDNGEYSLTPPDSNQVFCFQRKRKVSHAIVI